MFASVNGTNLAYTDEGQGLPLLFIHGFPLSSSVWSHQVKAFKSRYRVIVPDLRGFGWSQATVGPVSMRQFADDIWGLLQHLGVGPAILTGHSMGGYIALAFAKAYPKCLRGLVLAGTRAGADSTEVAEGRRATAEAVRQRGTSLVVEAMAPKMLATSNRDQTMAASVLSFMASASPDGIISALFGMADRPQATEWLGSIRVPTLVIAGADDRVIPLSESEILVEAIPDAQLKVIPNAGHLMAFEQPDAFNEAIQTWLALGCMGSKRRIRGGPSLG